ncbi:MAG: MTH1187 family thiamine-binding protein [Deltaproteobacteria bacterium]|nr:MAG: MTH1187 family thiamine-binding protein [Deltaproteobacteria bacterium]
MSALIDFSIFPLDKGDSLSAYVARVLKIIKDSGLPHKIGPMGTSVEGEWDQVMAVVTNCFEELKKDSDRVYMALKVDYRKGPLGRIESKVKSVEEKL